MGVSESKKEEFPKKPVHKSKEYSLMIYNQNQNIVTEKYIFRDIQKASISPFKSLEIESLQEDKSEEEACKPASFTLLNLQSTIIVKKEFPSEEDLQAYISNSIKIQILLKIKNYEQLDVKNEDQKYQCTMIQSIKNLIKLDKAYFSNNPHKKLDFLVFISNVITKTKNIFIKPEFIIEIDNNFLLVNFEASDITSEELLFRFILWLFGDFDNFQYITINCEISSIIPLYFIEICQQIKANSFIMNLNFLEELKKIKEKMEFLTGKADSLYACSYFKKIKIFLSSLEWIFLKKGNQIYFYNIKDEHVCHGKVIRKKRKIDIQMSHLVFDPQELQILYIPENTKFFVKANEFEMQQPTTISDIQIKYKLPIKFRNPLLLLQSTGDILILEQTLYRYSPSKNKIIQETKKINDFIFLTESKENSYLIIKSSIDIFKNGIRVYYNDEDFVLCPTGNETLLSEMASFRIDIRSVYFCIQIYRGVFIMMAAQNIWILDINFGCFFSFGSYSKLKEIFGFSKTTTKKIDYAFDILNQPFKVDFLPHQDCGNVTITSKKIHILGQISGKPYYLEYRILPRAGAISLEGYKPLFVDQEYKKLKPYNELAISEAKEYRFNFHQENSNIYKYGKWIFTGPLLLKVYDFNIKWSKTNYEAILQVQPFKISLKDEIQKLKKDNITLSKPDILMILHKILTIYEYLIKNSITHKNISVSNIYYTKNRQMKLTGWSEPPRNWHVSDFKDFLLTCFNVITYNSVEKFSQKLLKKHEAQLSLYPGLQDKIIICLKHSKTMEKKVEIEKHLLSIKQYLEKQLCPEFQNVKSNQFIFCFQFNTPRFNMMNTRTQKIKKMCIIIEDSMAEQFLFNQTDKYEWNEEEGYLYIFTATFQFYEVKINTEDMGQEKLTLEDYEYLPKNIIDSTFLFLHGSGLYSFGGVSKQSNGIPCFCLDIYKFNRKVLTWQVVGSLPQPRINPKAIVSACKQKIYLFGGLVDHEFPFFKMISFDYKMSQCELLIDKSIENPTFDFDQNSCYKVFHLSAKLHLFMLWYMEDGYYVVRYFSCLQSGFDITVRTKNFSGENYLSSVSITVEDNLLHILRQYGKYTRISIHKLESATVKSETIYSL